MPPKPQNIIFDLGNVIVDIDEASTFRALSAYLNEPATGRVPRSLITVIHAYEQGMIQTSEFLNEVRMQLPPELSEDQLIRAWNAMLLDIPRDRLRLIEQLRANYGVYILSNTNELHLDWVNRFLNQNYQIDSFDDLVDYALYSHHAYSRKPKPEIYRELLDRANISAESALFFDDKPENIEAAKAAGIAAQLSPPNIDIRSQCAVFL